MTAEKESIACLANLCDVLAKNAAQIAGAGIGGRGTRTHLTTCANILGEVARSLRCASATMANEQIIVMDGKEEVMEPQNTDHGNDTFLSESEERQLSEFFGLGSFDDE